MRKLCYVWFVLGSILALGLSCLPVQAQDLLVGGNSAEIQRYDGATGASKGPFTSGAGISYATGIVFGPDGNLYVNDQGANNILRFDGKTGTALPSAGNSGAIFASGDLNAPFDIAFGPDKNLYVANRANVLRFDGKTGASMGVFASGQNLDTGVAVGLAFGRNGNLYVGSYNDNRILRFDGNGGNQPDFITPGSGGLSKPNGMKFGPDGNLYVCSSGSNQIMRYNGTTGAPMPSIGNPGAIFASGHLSNPDDLAFSPNGDLYVTSFFTNSVVRYDGKDGHFISDFITTGSGLTQPFGLAFIPQVPAPDALLTFSLGLTAGAPLLWRKRLSVHRRA